MTVKRFYESIKDKTKFAKRCGISQGYFSQVMNGIKCPSFKVAEAISKASRGEITARQIQLLYLRQNKQQKGE